MRLLDLYCGGGGATRGYQLAGFEVWGVDHAPQPDYCGDHFTEGDVLALTPSYLATFDAVHASPPCQFATAYRHHGRVRPSPNLIPPTRRLLEAAGVPYVIENVAGARGHLRRWAMLCGSMFTPPLDVQRHRYFEANWPLFPPLPGRCRHWIWPADRYPGGRSRSRTGSSRGLVRATVEVGTWDIPLPVQQEAMGIDWLPLEALSEAIPPAYTAHIGAALRAHLGVTV